MGGSLTVVPEHGDPHPALRGLYEKAERAFWSPSRDVDWTLPHTTEAPRYFRWAWRYFEPFNALPREQQDTLCNRQYKWVLDQGVHGEMFGMLAAGWLAQHAETAQERMVACEIAWEEARHDEAIKRVAELLGPVGPPHPDVLATVEWAEAQGHLGVYMGLQAGERAGVPSYQLLARFGGPLLREVYGRVGGDESRHLAVGVLGIKRHMERVSHEHACSVAQRVVDGYSHWAFPSPTWEGMGFDEQEVRAYWLPFYRKSRLRRAMLDAFRKLGLDVV